MKKYMFLLVTMLLGSVSFAAGDAVSCPDVNGVYKTSDITAIRLTQNNCVSLSVAQGEFQDFGRIEWHKAFIKTSLNGAETCTEEGCVSSRTNAEKIELIRDNAWKGMTSEHGVCSYNYENYSAVTSTYIVRTQKVFNCQDGFSGILITVLPRIN
jgi:hypothetical protein